MMIVIDKVVIKKVEANEFCQLEELIRQQQLFHYNLSTPNSERFLKIGVKEFTDYMLAESDYACFMAYNEFETPIGFTACTVSKDGNAFIEDIFVNEKYRGSGIGNDLMRTILHWCGENKYNNISVHVTDNNEGVFGFYEKYGFKLKEKDDKGYILAT